MQKFKIKKVLEIVFIEEWNTHAYICEGGDIWIQLRLGKFYNKEKFITSPEYNQSNEKFKEERLKLFEYLENYHKQNLA